MPALSKEALDKYGYKYEILDPEVFLVHNFLTQEEVDSFYSLAEATTEEEWLGAYLKGIEDRTEARYGDRDVEAHKVEVTHDWNDKVIHVFNNPSIQDLIPRLKNLFDPEQELYFRNFGIIQRQYTGAELRGHYDQYVDNRMKYAAVAYINDNYTEGELYFSEKGIAIRPPIGSVIVFPCTEEYWHGVKAVGEGPTRYAMPTFIWNDPDAF